MLSSKSASEVKQLMDGNLIVWCSMWGSHWLPALSWVSCSPLVLSGVPVSPPALRGYSERGSHCLLPLNGVSIFSSVPILGCQSLFVPSVGCQTLLPSSVGCSEVSGPLWPAAGASPGSAQRMRSSSSD